MGARFEAKFANLVGYLTDDQNKPPPQVTKNFLWAFFESFAQEQNIQETIGNFGNAYSKNATAYLDLSGDGEAEAQFEHDYTMPAPIQLISYDDWSDHLKKIAKKQSELLEPFSTDFLDSAEAQKLLDPLQEFFRGYSFYAMVFSKEEDVEGKSAATRFFEEMAKNAGVFGLIFKPMHLTSFLDFVDPFPCVHALGEHPVEFPAVVFWTSDGSALSMNLRDGINYFNDTILPNIMTYKDKVGGKLSQAFSSERNQQKTKKILHLSDLHFGKSEAAQRRSYLKEELETICKDVDRVVITGDLFDNPKAELRTEFDEFKTDVERFTKLPVLVIPGNHDVRTKGNKVVFGENFKYVATLWKPLEIDHGLRTVFFCFNSCEEGDFAKGRVTKQQRLDMAAGYKKAIRENSKIENYTKIALVHHHPLPLEQEPEATVFYQRLVQKFWPADKFIAFENANEFNNWCIKMGVSLILHGHKHFPRQSLLDENTFVVGCGSTTGVENTPMCYDIVTLDEASNKWSVKFYMDEAGDGSGFELQAVALTT